MDQGIRKRFRKPERSRPHSGEPKQIRQIELQREQQRDEAEEGRYSHAAIPETTITAKHRTTGNQGTTRVSGTSGSRAIFVEERGETYNLLPFEEPIHLRVESIGDGLPQRVSGFAAPVHDPAEICLMNAYHLGKAILANSSLVDRQLQIWVNRPLIGFHFLLASQ
jgi:hypothetical protein